MLMFIYFIFFVHRGAGPGGQRSSMFGTYGGTEKMKDPRPLHDKSFVQQCIKQLCEVCEIENHLHSNLVE